MCEHVFEKTYHLDHPFEVQQGAEAKKAKWQGEKDQQQQEKTKKKQKKSKKRAETDTRLVFH